MAQQRDAARMKLEPDAWHQNDQGAYYVDCPECGSAATVSNVVNHGRCNAYLDEREGETDVDESAMSCTARLSFELVYSADPGQPRDEAVAGDSSSTEDSDAGESPDASTDEVGAGTGSDVDGTVED